MQSKHLSIAPPILLAQTISIQIRNCCLPSIRRPGRPGIIIRRYSKLIALRLVVAQYH